MFGACGFEFALGLGDALIERPFLFAALVALLALFIERGLAAGQLGLFAVDLLGQAFDTLFALEHALLGRAGGRGHQTVRPDTAAVEGDEALIFGQLRAPREPAGQVVDHEYPCGQRRDDCGRFNTVGQAGRIGGPFHWPGRRRRAGFHQGERFVGPIATELGQLFNHEAAQPRAQHGFGGRLPGLAYLHATCNARRLGLGMVGQPFGQRRVVFAQHGLLELALRGQAGARLAKLGAAGLDIALGVVNGHPQGFVGFGLFGRRAFIFGQAR